MSDASRHDQVRQLHAQLEQQVTELVSGEDWARMLQLASRFHRYSANNVMLILAQCPDATRVAGFNSWKTFGRHVVKGERGIRILAPCAYKVESDDGDDRYVLRGFKPVCVFDVAQTDGEPLADDIRPVLLAGDAPAGLWDALAAQVAAAGYQLVRGECGGANGRTDYASRTVTVRDDVDDAQAAKTLCHELGHVLLGHEGELFGGCRGRLEVEAESVAYIVAAASGLSTDGYSLPYVSSWAGGDVAVVRQTADTVIRTAAGILAALAGAETSELVAA